MSVALADESESRSISLALRRRDADFIARLVSQYHYRLLRYLVYLTSRRELAEDLIQETWLRVLERGAQYNDRHRFEPWLFSIARNLAIDSLRRLQRTDTPDPVPDVPASDQQSPFLTAARSEDAERIASALATLEPIYREALLLRFQEDLSFDEIARVVGVPVSTIASRVYRGIAQLRTALAGDTHAA